MKERTENCLNTFYEASKTLIPKPNIVPKQNKTKLN